ncbi:MAG: hypothetical protein KY442_12170, partial [Proteobacteria bacterium]|nr:hypothetical protein [Pseudomonadota bacterium]
MRATWKLKSLLAGSLVLGAALNASAGDFTERVEQAYAARTADPAVFDRLLTELERDSAQATEREREHLRLLLDYRKVLRGHYEAALGDAVALHDQAQDPEVRYRAALLVANTAGVAREFLLGLRYLERALQLREQVPESPWRHNALTVAGTLYNQYGQFALGRQYAEQALAEETLPPRLGCIAGQIRIEALHGLGMALDEAGDVESAIRACMAVGEPLVANGIRSTLAHYWAAKGRHRQAIALLQAHLPAIEATAYPWLIGEVRSQLAAYQLEVGNDTAAEPHARAAVKLAGGSHAGSVIAAH